MVSLRGVRQSAIFPFHPYSIPAAGRSETKTNKQKAFKHFQLSKQTDCRRLSYKSNMHNETHEL